MSAVQLYSCTVYLCAGFWWGFSLQYLVRLDCELTALRRAGGFEVEV